MTFEITPAQPDFSPTCGHGIDQARQKFDDGRRHFSAGDLKQAEQCFMRAVELRHDFAEAHHALGELFAASGRDEDALDAYYLAVHFSPAMAAAHLGIAALLSAGQRHAEAEAACRAALAVDNKSTSAWFCLGNVLKAGGDHVRAMEAYRAACASDPGNLKALHQLAYVEFRLGRYADALRDFQVLLQSEPDQANARHNFGLLLLETGYPQEALDNFRHALRLQPGVVETITCTGHALRDLGQIDEAIAAYDTALALRADFGDAISNRCQTQLLGGDFARGWEQYERRFSASNTRARTVGTSVWRGEDLAGKKIVVLPEQGIGDQIMFASCLRDLIAVAGRVRIECEPRLAPLLARSFPDAEVGIFDEAAGKNDARRDRAEFEVSIGSLPRVFRSARASFPQSVGYLKADPDKLQHWRNAFAAPGARRIGFSWRGGTLRTRQLLRSLDPAELGPLLRKPGCSIVNLQYGLQNVELHRVVEQIGDPLPDLAKAVGDNIDELAAGIAGLDLVITVDNTIAHLSAALGIPTWVLVPYSPEWRYGLGAETVVWYPTMRLFRQSLPRQWSPVIERVSACL